MVFFLRFRLRLPDSHPTGARTEERPKEAGRGSLQAHIRCTALEMCTQCRDLLRLACQMIVPLNSRMCLSHHHNCL